MKIDKLIVGLIVIVLAALLLANSVIFFVGQTTMFSQDVVNLFVGFVLVVLAGAYFKEAKE
jgi:uncharacterized integral membrane protein